MNVDGTTPLSSFSLPLYVAKTRADVQSAFTLSKRGGSISCLETSRDMAMGEKPVPPVNIPIPTKID